MNAMKKYISLFLLIIVISACKKEKDTPLPLKPSSGISFKALNITIDSLQYTNPIQLDLDNDGSIDYNLSSVLLEQEDLPYMYLFIRGDSRAKNQIMVKAEPELALAGYWVNPFNKDVEINNAPVSGCKWNDLLTKGFLMGLSDNGINKVFSGAWIGKQDKYVGLKFTVGGKYHYGWLRVSHMAGRESLLVADCAYNEEPGKSIMAGQR